MAHKIAIYYPEAQLGRAEFFTHGTATLSGQVYSDPNGTVAVSTHTLSAVGRLTRYVTEPVDVVVKTAAGATVDTFTEIGDARLVRVENAFATGPNANGSLAIAGRTTVQAIYTSLRQSFNDEDGYVNVNGVPQLLYEALGSTTGVFYNVKSGFGAAGDGVSDDRAAIQSAINAASSTGGIVFFPPGTYRITGTLTVLSGSGVTLLGTNSQIGSSRASIIYVDANGLASGGLSIQADQMEVRNLQFATAATGTTSHLIHVVTNTPEGVQFVSCTFLGGADAIMEVVTATSSPGAIFSGCTLQLRSTSGRFTVSSSGGGATFDSCILDINGITPLATVFDTAPYIFSGCLLTTFNAGIATGTYTIFPGGGSGSGPYIFNGCRLDLNSTGAIALFTGGLINGDFALLTGNDIIGGTGLVVANGAMHLVEYGNTYRVSGTLSGFANAERSDYRETRRPVQTTLNGTSYTPSMEYAQHEVLHASGASMAFNNPSVNVSSGMRLRLVYKNNTGGARTPTWGTLYSGVPGTAVNNGNTAIYEFVMSTIVGGGAEWLCTTASPMVSGA